MPRVKRGSTANKKRRKVLQYTKGFRWSRKSKERAAKEALLHAWTNAFRGRKEKKRDFRRLWTAKINAGTRMSGMTYSAFVAALKKKNIAIDRKILADLAEHAPKVFSHIVESVK